jgi:sugar lactone lactonase YvrE
VTDSNTAADREAAQKRLQELIERNERGGDGTARRTRVILVVVLIVLLLLLCGVGAFLARLLIPNNDTKGTQLQGSEDTGGIIWIRSIYGFGPDIKQMFVNPNGVATGPDGIVWVTDPGGNSRVVGFRGDGTYVKQIQGSRETGQPFRVPSQIAIDPSNIMYLADRVTERLTIMDGTKKLADAKIPGLMSVAADDQIIVVGSKSGFAILDKDGNAKSVVGTKGNGADQFDTVSGVALDSATKTIYVVDTYNNRLSAWDYNGKRKWIVTTGNPPNDVKLAGGTSIVTSTTAPAKLQLPVSVTIDGKGRPMVLDGFGFTISAFEPADGKYVGSWGAWGEADGQFLYPTAVSYDKSKDWFLVADTSNLRAQIVRIPGTSAGGPSGALSGLQRLLAGPLRALWPCCILLPLLLLLLLLGRWRKRRRELQGGAVQPAVEGADEELSQV